MIRVLILGAGDRSTACAIRLLRAGFAVCIVEEDKPLDLFINRTFTKAVYAGSATIEAVTARTLANAVETDLLPETVNADTFTGFVIANREIPLLLLSDLNTRLFEGWDYVVIARPSLLEAAAACIPETCRRIAFDDTGIEAAYRIAVRLPLSGRVRYPFLDDAFRDMPPVKTRPHQRVHVPMEGIFIALRKVNEHINEKEELAKLNDIPILAPEAGRLVGILNSGIIIPSGTDFAEIAPFHSSAYGDVIPPVEWGMAGGVLEALMYDRQM